MTSGQILLPEWVYATLEYSARIVAYTHFFVLFLYWDFHKQFFFMLNVRYNKIVYVSIFFFWFHSKQERKKIKKQNKEKKANRWPGGFGKLCDFLLLMQTRKTPFMLWMVNDLRLFNSSFFINYCLILCL